MQYTITFNHKQRPFEMNRRNLCILVQIQQSIINNLSKHDYCQNSTVIQLPNKQLVSGDLYKQNFYLKYFCLKLSWW